MAEITSAEIDAEVEGRTVPRGFLETVGEHGERVALRWKNPDDSWAAWTWNEYADHVARAATGLREHGVGWGDRIVIMMRNIPEFHVIDMAAYFVGATPVSIYNSSSPEQVQYLAEHCDAKLALVEDVGFLERFLKVRSEIPSLEHLGVLRDPSDMRPDDVYLMEELLDREPADLEEAASIAQPEDLCTIIYTSGTTGPPKGVMLTHYNIAWTGRSLQIALPFDSYVGKRVVSYLPMAHIAERVTSHYNHVFLGFEVTTCPDPAGIAGYLTDVRPNLIFGVPRVWEKISAGVNAAMASDPEKQARFDEAVRTAIPISERIDWGTATEEDRQTWDFLNDVAFQQIRELVGLDQVEAAISGAAPIPPEVLSWFRAVGVPLSEIYGMSESSGPMTWTAEHVKPGTVGPAIPGCEVTLADDGEIICRGGNVFGGYMHEPEKTAATLDEEGWLHSGDIGEVDEDGYFRVVDRKKELIITAGGKNISPANLEAELKTIPLVGQAAAIGDRRPFVSALVVLDPEVAPAWARQRGIEFDSLEDLAVHPEVREEVDRGLEEVMSKFNQAERVKKVHILGEEWLPDSEVLTPTSKLKRRGIYQRYEDVIEALYG